MGVRYSAHLEISNGELCITSLPRYQLPCLALREDGVFQHTPRLETKASQVFRT